MMAKGKGSKTLILFIAILFNSLSVNSQEENLIHFADDQLDSTQKNKVPIDKATLKELFKEGAISELEAEKEQKRIDNLDTTTNFNIKEDVETETLKDKKNKLEKVTSWEFLNKGKTSQLSIRNLGNIKQSNILKKNYGWDIIFYPVDYSSNIDSIKELTKLNDGLEEINFKVEDGKYIVSLVLKNNFNTSLPTVIINKDIIKINIKNIKLSNKNFLENSIISRSKLKKSGRTKSLRRAIAPPLGDMAIGSVLLKNRGFIEVDGPEIESLSLNNASSIQALIEIADMAGYGFVYVKGDTKSNAMNNYSLSNKVNNNKNLGPKVTLSFNNITYAKAINSILLAANLQGKKDGNLLIVGDNVLDKSFSPQLSKVYRLNQASSNSAADYLASLGARINKVNIITQTSAGSNTSSNNSSTSNSFGPAFTSIDTYSASTGPLKGLVGTTDSRLQTITLIGSSNLISIAEKYLKQLDLRQRQVALSVKILDVDLSNTDETQADIAIRMGSTFIVNNNGQLKSVFGSYLPSKLDTLPSINTNKSTIITENDTDGITSKITEKVTSTTESNSVTPNPGMQYPNQQTYAYLVSKIKSSSTKVLASPTLILSESPERISGGKEQNAQLGGSSSATIGRPYANESFITVGKRIITDFDITPGTDGAQATCKPKFSTAGLTFGARVNKIDDNGYVTFSLSPELTSINEKSAIPNCGFINILSVRRLDTGTLRVRDSQTLILTGVISNLDTEIANKWPILGDIPIAGRLFRSTSGETRKSELVIMVTPKIIDDSDPGIYKLGYTPNTEQSKELFLNN